MGGSGRADCQFSSPSCWCTRASTTPRASSPRRSLSRARAREAVASWDSLPSAIIPVDADHPYARDIDVFGRASLMSIVDATETRFGQEHLARLLSQGVPVGWPEEGARATGGGPGSRFALWIPGEARRAGGAAAGRRPPRCACGPRLGRRSDYEVSTATRWIAWLLPAFAAGVVAFGSTFGLSAGAVTVLVAVEIALGNVFGARAAPMLDSVSARRSWVTQWRTLIAAIESESFDRRSSWSCAGVSHRAVDRPAARSQAWSASSALRTPDITRGFVMSSGPHFYGMLTAPSPFCVGGRAQAGICAAGWTPSARWRRSPVWRRSRSSIPTSLGRCWCPNPSSRPRCSDIRSSPTGSGSETT
jgi:hypothetical protein